MEYQQEYDFVILYGSQTGTAEYASQELQREAGYRKLKTKCLSMNDFPLENLPNEKVVIFVVATTGQGDPPDNMKNFWQFLLIKDLPKDCLKDLKFGVFGLGDKKYVKFNAMARKLKQRLLQLGAQQIQDIGLGDEQHPLGYEAEFDPWLQKLWITLSEQVFPEKNISQIIIDKTVCPQPKYKTQLINSEYTETIKEYIQDTRKYLPSPLASINKNQVFLAKCTKNQKLTPQNHFQDVRNIQFSIENLKYSPGDVLMIQPRNDPETCKKLANLLQLDYDQVIKIVRNTYVNENDQWQLPEYITIKELFEIWLDVMKPPTRYFFKIISFFTNEELHKQKLQLMSSKTVEGMEEYTRYCYKEKRNVYEILYDFDSVKLNLDYLLEALGLLKPREYSICTSHKAHPHSVGIVAALIEYETASRRKIQGVCSQYFKKLTAGEDVLIWIRKGALSFQMDSPKIIVGPGTGIAPFISYIEEKQYTSEQNSNTEEIKDIIIFGNRNYEMDFLFKDLLIQLSENKKIILITAFSRDQTKKIYVQQKIKENSSLIGSFINKHNLNLMIYVAGNARQMPEDVEDAFKQVLKEYYQFGSIEEAANVINILKKKKQYLEETW